MSNSYKGEEDALNIFNPIMDDTEFDKISHYFTLVKVNRSIIYANKYIKAKVIDKKFLDYFNINKSLKINFSPFIISTINFEYLLLKNFNTLKDKINILSCQI